MSTLTAEGALTPADTGNAPADTGNAPDGAEAGNEGQSRDYEAEARAQGWQPPEEFKGDKARCVDAKTFVERADTFVPFIKKAHDATKRELDELKRTVKQYAKHAGKVEERAYTRALADLRAEHREAVETGDIAGAERASDEIATLKADAASAPKVADEPDFDPVQARRELNAWIDDNDWYETDDAKRRYADRQAEEMGPAIKWDGGQQAWLAELGKRVTRKFADPKPNVTNGGGNRQEPGGTGKTFSDLPAGAKAACDRFIKSGIIKTREQYVKDYDFGA